MSDIQNVSGLNSSTAIDPNTSLQFMYAQLQLIQSQTMKNQAMEVMKQIEDTQKLQKETADFISKARSLQEKAKNGDTCTEMPADMVKFFTDHGLSWDTKGNDKIHNKDEWEYNIKSLTNYQDQLGTDTQTKMVYLQDYISQYNSYLQGASTQISNSMDTQKTILRNS